MSTGTGALHFPVGIKQYMSKVLNAISKDSFLPAEKTGSTSGCRHESGLRAPENIWCCSSSREKQRF
jgi:hypothetical protein